MYDKETPNRCQRVAAMIPGKTVRDVMKLEDDVSSIEADKLFENALAVYDKETPNRWQRVAAMIPGKTARDVMKQYKELEDDVSSIEAGLVPNPWDNSSPFYIGMGK
ncbi:Transcription factor DIVARICATA [Camellia lanceoleosa]|uniref:Transcription factor DIVARICATA n=1 Tax=Camellia lanceoleosa TaxID=1840588 RepID=A0ACC0H111_9ERIC|nr:Transcription factor DIVARICATA [Camellia lanceoleosa]